MDEHQFQKRVGKNIRNQRKLVGMTMKELGEKVGLTESSISKYESGDINQLGLELLKRMAEALSCHPDDLTRWDKGEQEFHTDNANARRLAKHNKLYEQLSSKNQKQVDEYIKFLLNQQKSQNTHKDNDTPN